MIRKSFIFLENINQATERAIWDQGIIDWDDFLSSEKVKGISSKRKAFYDRKLREAKRALYSFDSSYFIGKLPRNEYWRLYNFFKDEAVYLDIETSGFGKHSYITVIGLFDGYDTKIMIKDINLDMDALVNELKRYKLIVTFNGAVFDIPFIRKRYPYFPNIPNFDLRFCCGKLGLKGGLKDVEKRVGIRRSKVIEELSGGDALTLWKMYKATGDEYYLELLVNYNGEDCMNLKTIAEHVYKRMEEFYTLKR